MQPPRESALREHDAMRCRSCGNEERASEGYPCASCGTFICLMCVFKGVVRCTQCAEQSGKSSTDVPILRNVPDRAPRIDWPEH
jgi:hypothetical protein